MSDSNTQPSKEEYPDLKGQLNLRINNDTRAVIAGGRVAFMTENYEYISVSEWEFKTLVEAWLDARLAQHKAQDEPGITSGDYE